MNYLEYTVGKLMVDSFERGIVKYLGKQSSVGKKCECRLNSCYNSLENTLHYLKENYADRLYCFNVDSLRSSEDIDRLLNQLYRGHKCISSIDDNSTNEEAFSKLIEGSRDVFEVERVIKRLIVSDWNEHLSVIDSYHPDDVITDPKLIVRAIDPSWYSLRTCNIFIASLFKKEFGWYNNRSIAIAYKTDPSSLVCMDAKNPSYNLTKVEEGSLQDILFDTGGMVGLQFYTDKDGIFSMFDQFAASANRFGGTIVLKSEAEPIAVLVKNISNRDYRYASSLALVMELPLYKLVGEELHKQEVVL